MADAIMARRQSRNFSFGDEDLQTFVKQYKLSTAKDTSNTMNSVDER